MTAGGSANNTGTHSSLQAALQSLLCTRLLLHIKLLAEHGTVTFGTDQSFGQPAIIPLSDLSTSKGSTTSY